MNENRNSEFHTAAVNMVFDGNNEFSVRKLEVFDLLGYLVGIAGKEMTMEVSGNWRCMEEEYIPTRNKLV